jgi:SAM-dependent methyltransferase
VPISPFRQLAIQATAAFAVLSLLWPYHGFSATPYQWPLVTLAIGIAASGIATMAGQPWWWRLIHLLFAPLAWAVAQFPIDPIWYFVAFSLLLLLFRGAVGGQIPLYLSSQAAAAELARLIEARRCRRFLDLGAGIGSTVIPLARQFPGTRFVGVENSPLPWLIGRLRTRALANVEWRWGNLWATDLSPFDLVYAFLSPAPMPELARKVGAEMQPGTIFVSNSFDIPEQDAVEQHAAGEQTFFLYAPESLKTLKPS